MWTWRIRNYSNIPIRHNTLPYTIPYRTRFAIRRTNSVSCKNEGEFILLIQLISFFQQLFLFHFFWYLLKMIIFHFYFPSWNDDNIFILCITERRKILFLLITACMVYVICLFYLRGTFWQYRELLNLLEGFFETC